METRRSAKRREVLRGWQERERAAFPRRRLFNQKPRTDRRKGAPWYNAHYGPGGPWERAGHPPAAVSEPEDDEVGSGGAGDQESLETSDGKDPDRRQNEMPESEGGD